MARFAKGSRALSISDRSGAEFPYNEMVREWNGSWVHNSEFEPKQPQLQPHPVGADPQALLRARPARTEFPVQDILPKNPFTTAATSKSVSVSYPANNFNEGTTYVRFQDVKNPVGGVIITILELSTTLNGALNDTATTIPLTNAASFPTSGYIVIEKVDQDSTSSTFGQFKNEVVQYTGIATNSLTGCTRGTSAPYKGNIPPATTAGSHNTLAKVYGCYLATAVASTIVVGPLSQTATVYNNLTFPLIANATSTEIGGGFQCTIGPVNDRA
jgi:hypothetical protein